jgi:type IV pilus assembly protein PilO
MYMEQPLEMKTSGDFNGFYQFMTKLEQLPRITRVPDMKLARSDKTNGVMTAEFTLSIYFQDENEQRPGPVPAAGSK